MTAARTGRLTLAHAHLKRATRDLVDAVGGGARGSGLCRVRQQDLSDYGNRDQPGRFMPADVIRDLEAVADWPFVTEALATERGFVLFRLPEPEDATGDWPVMLAKFGKEAGEVVSKVATHVLGGITAREVRDSGLIAEIDEALAVLVNMRAAAVAAVEA